MERMVPTREELQRRYLDDLPERLDRFREVAGLTWRELAHRIGVTEGQIARWRLGRIPSGEAMGALLALSAQVPGGLEALYPEFVPGAENEDEEGDEPWA